LAVFVAVALLFFTLSHAIRYFLLLFAGILIACFWIGLARWLKGRTGWSHGVSLTITIALCFALVGGIFWYLGPAFSKQFEELVAQVPETLSKLQGEVSESPWGQRLTSMMPEGSELVSKPEKLISQVAGILSMALGMVVDLVLVLALSIFISANPDMYKDGFTVLFPKHSRERLSHVLSASSYTLFMWLVGRILDMALVGIATGIGLWLLGFELALALGILTALLCFIPNIGPLLSAVPPVLIAMTDPQLSVLWVIVLYITIQTLESYLLTPVIQERAVEMPPALLLVAQVIFAAVWGALGLLLATPLVAVAMVFIKMLYVEDMLETELPPKGELETDP
jgi:predicted PurR-regulated permease PerM